MRPATTEGNTGSREHAPFGHHRASRRVTKPYARQSCRSGQTLTAGTCSEYPGGPVRGSHPRVGGGFRDVRAANF